MTHFSILVWHRKTNSEIGSGTERAGIRTKPPISFHHNKLGNQLFTFFTLYTSIYACFIQEMTSYITIFTTTAVTLSVQMRLVFLILLSFYNFVFMWRVYPIVYKIPYILNRNFEFPQCYTWLRSWWKSEPILEIWTRATTYVQTRTILTCCQTNA